MRFTRIGFGGLLGIALVGGLAARAAEIAPLKFQLVRSHLVIVHGGIGRLEGLNFLIDTGAMPTMVDRKVAKKLALDAREMEFIAFGQKTRVATAVLPEIRLGTLKFQSVTAGIGDLSFVSGVDVIIGLDVLSRISFSIDYNQHLLTFGPVSPHDPAIPLELVSPFLTVQVNILHQPFRFMVDTGSGRLVLFDHRVHNRLPPLSIHGELLINHLAGTSKLSRVLLPAVEVGATALGHVEGFISDASLTGYPPSIDGVLGVRALASKRADFDFERNQFAFIH